MNNLLKFCSLASLAFLMPSAIAGEVQFEGSLREMHHGNYEGKVDLHALGNKGYLTAVGPLEELQGEFTAYKGQIFSTRMINGQLESTNNLTGLKASFLVWTYAEKWTKPTPIQFDADNLETIESKIEAAATRKGISTDRSFSFALKGTVDELQYHVLSPLPVASLDKNHKAGAFVETLQNAEVILVGFYSKNHAGVFTHKSARIHLHVLNRDHTGHVDALKLNKQMEIEFACN